MLGARVWAYSVLLVDTFNLLLIVSWKHITITDKSTVNIVNSNQYCQIISEITQYCPEFSKIV